MALTKIPGNLIQTGAITAAALDDDAVTTAKVLDANITHAKLHATMDLTGKTVTVATAAGSTNTTAAASTAFVQQELTSGLAPKATIASPTFTGTPSAPTASGGTNTTALASTAFVQQELTTLIGGAPSTLNDLNELAAAINDDANYNTTLTTALATKLPLAGGAMTGAITTNSTFDGVDIAARDAILTSTTTTAGAALPKAGGTMTGAATFSAPTTTLGSGAANTNVELNLNGVGSKATRIQFREGVTPRWLLGQGAATETSAFEIYNSVGVVALSINRSSSLITLGAGLGVTGSSTFTPSAGENVVITRDSSGPYIGTSSNHSLRLITNNATRMDITSGGDVYIGTSGKFFWDASAESLSIGTNGSTTDRRFQVSASGTSTATTQFGIVANPTYPTNVTGSVYNLYTGPNLTSGTTLTNLHNLYLESNNLNGSTVTNSYALYQAGASDKNYFAGKVGIGTSVPDLPFHVSGTVALPATSGSTPVGMMSLRAKTANASHGLHMGVSNASPWGSWLQAQDANNLATEYPLLLNPNGGNVGIGTTTPGNKLHVKTSAAGAIAKIEGETGRYIYTGTDGSGHFIEQVATSAVTRKLRIQGSDGSGTYTQLFIDSGNQRIYTNSGTNVGIGTTAPASPLEVSESFAGAAGSTKLRITSKHAGSYTGQSHIDFAYNDYGNVNVPNITASIQALSSVTSPTNVGGELLFATKALGGSTTTAPVERMRIKSDGKVAINHGLGGGAINSQFNVFADGEAIRLDGTAGTSRTLRFRNAATNGSGNAIITSDGILQIKTEDANAHIYMNSVRDIAMQTTSLNGTAGHFTFSSYNTEIMRIDGASNSVGIGTTAPTSKLHISNNGGPADDLTLLTLENGNGSGDIGTPDTWIDFVFKDTNTNVTPQARIGAHAGDGGDANTQILEGKGYLTFHTSGTTATSGDLDPPERMRIDSAGAVTVPGTLHSPGHVIQTQHATNGTTITLSQTQNTYATIVQVNITPKYATSKILITGYGAVEVGTGHYPTVHCKIFRDSTEIEHYNYWGYEGATQTHRILMEPLHFLDSPTTTSALTYYVKIANSSGSGYTGTYQGKGNNYNVSAITVQEIAQ